MVMFPLRRILAASLVLLAVVPALLVLVLLGRAGEQAIEEMAGRVLTQLGEQVQRGTETHLQQAHDVLDALFPPRMPPAEAERARAWLRDPVAFEPMAFALTRLSPSVPALHFANLRGDYLGLVTAADGTRLAQRAGEGGRTVHLIAQPGDRSRLVGTEPGNFEPRTTAWYGAAVQAKDRVFTPVRVAADRRELMVTLAQPVYDPDGGVAGVFAADLHLQQLADLLRTQRLSARGGAFVVDESDRLVASSAGDPLFTADAGRIARPTPAASANPVIRIAYQGLLAQRAARASDSVASDTRLRRLASPQGTVLMVQRPFGESLGLRWTLVVAAPESDFTADLVRARQVALYAAGALVAIGTLLAFLLARGIGRRLRRLSDAAGQIGRGEVPQAEQRTRIAEVHHLSRVLHDSAQQLRDFRQQVADDARALQQANETLEARVQARTAELAASREEALAAARAKAAFLATMSHEIRTPLNGVVGMSTLLAETSLDHEQRDYLQTIRLSSDQLLAVINDILDFSKIESGKLELESEPVSLRGAVEEACDIAAPRAREKGLELVIDIADSGEGAVPGAIVGDITRLRQVLINLVNNAVKFTAAGEVAVHVRQLAADDGRGRAVLEFRVTDTGIGIPPDRLATLFEAFTQVDASTTRKYGGTGLGLAICKRLVELMGGRLGVESQPGQGSTFWFTIAAPATTLAPMESAADAGSLGGARVLVVDDHATNVRVLSRQLHLWGMQVVAAESAQAALSLWSDAAPPHVVITDMHMPEMDGVALAHALKADARRAKVPIVLLSSGFMPAADESARLFAARLLKPARQTQLFETLVRCLATEPGHGARAQVQAAGPARDATVLVADDNAVNLKVACAMLAKLGYGILTATDGREAVEAVAQAASQDRRIAAVLMDVNMPDVDGLEATRQIHAAWGRNSPPIIALTAAASSEDRQRCHDAGMDDYLTKPLQVAELARALEKWIGDAAAAPARPDRAAGAQAEAKPGGGIAVPATVLQEATSPPAAGGEEADPAPAFPGLPAADAVPAPVYLDPARLQEFREFDDEELTMTREVVTLFQADTPPRLAEITAAAAAGDAARLAKAAHAVKGAAGNIGAQALHLAAARLEDGSKAGLPPDAQAQVAHLHALWECTEQSLRAWNGLPPTRGE